MDLAMNLLIVVIFFIIGLIGQIIILKIQDSTTLKYDSDFARSSKLVLTIFIIISGLLLMFISYRNILAVPGGIIGIFWGEKWYYKLLYETQNKKDKEYQKNMKEIDNEIEDYFGQL